MPSKKTTKGKKKTTKKTDVSVKGKKNQTQVQNVTIKIGSKSRAGKNSGKSGATGQKQSGAQTHNIVISAPPPPPNPTSINPPIFRNEPAPVTLGVHAPRRPERYPRSANSLTTEVLPSVNSLNTNPLPSSDYSIESVTDSAAKDWDVNSQLTDYTEYTGQTPIPHPVKEMFSPSILEEVPEYHRYKYTSTVKQESNPMLGPEPYWDNSSDDDTVSLEPGLNAFSTVDQATSSSLLKSLQQDIDPQTHSALIEEQSSGPVFMTMDSAVNSKLGEIIKRSNMLRKNQESKLPPIESHKVKHEEELQEALTMLKDINEYAAEHPATQKASSDDERSFRSTNSDQLKMTADKLWEDAGYPETLKQLKLPSAREYLNAQYYYMTGHHVEPGRGKHGVGIAAEYVAREFAKHKSK
jgi:hypothetical protein